MFFGYFGWVQLLLRIAGRLSDVLTEKFVVERRYVLRWLFVRSLSACLWKKVGNGCILLNIAALLLICWCGLLILCVCALFEFCSQVSGKWVKNVGVSGDLFAVSKNFFFVLCLYG